MSKKKALVDMATACTAGIGVVAVQLFNDGSLAYTTWLNVTKTRWQYAQAPEREAKLQSVSVVADKAGTLYVTVAYQDGVLAFAKIERFFTWHIVNRP